MQVRVGSAITREPSRACVYEGKELRVLDLGSRVSRGKLRKGVKKKKEQRKIVFDAQQNAFTFL